MHHKNMLKEWKLALLVVTGIFLFWAIQYFFVCKIPKVDLTKTRMRGIQVRVIRYYKNNGALPELLIDLPSELGKDSKIVDAWQRPIDYKIDGNLITLCSLGSDGIYGGNDLSEDIVLVFNPKNSELLESFDSTVKGQ